MNSIVTQHPSVSTPIVAKRRKHHSKTASLAQVIPTQVSTEQVVPQKLKIQGPLQEAMKDLDAKYSEIIIPLLNKASSVGCVLTSHPLSFSLSYGIKQELAEARMAHEQFFSTRPPVKASFDMACFMIGANSKALDKLVRMNQPMDQILRGFKAALSSLCDIKEGVLPSRKKNTARLSAMKTRSLSNAIQSLEFMIDLLQSDNGKKILGSSFLDVIAIPTETLLKNVPQIIDHFLVHIQNDIFAEEVYAKASLSQIRPETKQSIIQRSLTELRHSDMYDLDKIQALNKLVIELINSDQGYLDTRVLQNTSHYTCLNLAQILVNWEALQIHTNSLHSQAHYNNLFAILKKCEASLEKIREKEVLKYFENIPAFKLFHDKTKEHLDRFFDSKPENTLSNLKMVLTKFKDRKTVANPLEFLTIMNEVEELRKAFHLTWHAFASNESLANFFILRGCLEVDFKQYDPKEIEKAVLSLPYWFFNETYLPHIFLENWRNNLEPPTAISTKKKRRRGKRNKEKETVEASEPRKAKKKEKSATQELLEQVSSAKNRKSGRVKKLAEEYGWVLDHTTGGHHIYKHPQIAGSLSVPEHDVLKIGTARAIIKQMMSFLN